MLTDYIIILYESRDVGHLSLCLSRSLYYDRLDQRAVADLLPSITSWTSLHTVSVFLSVPEVFRRNQIFFLRAKKCDFTSKRSQSSVFLL